MYIKYLGNIHNLRKFRTIGKSTNLKCISLGYESTHISLEFQTEDARDFVLGSIWQEIEKGSKIFDIDKLVDTYYEARKYNVV